MTGYGRAETDHARNKVQRRTQFRQPEAKRHRDQFAARSDRARAAHSPDDQ